MARLYAKMRSEGTHLDRTVAGQREIMTEVNYGSKEDSKLAVRVRVVWRLNDEKPIVYVYPMEGISVKVCDRY